MSVDPSRDPSLVLLLLALVAAAALFAAAERAGWDTVLVHETGD